MQAQLRLIQTKESKGKSSERTSTVTDELQYLLNFNTSITQCMAITIKLLSELVFITVANMTLARRDAYLVHVKAGIKHDTLSTLRQATIHLDKLFPDQGPVSRSLLKIKVTLNLRISLNFSLL